MRKINVFKNLKLRYKIVIPLLLVMLFLFIAIIIITIYAQKKTYDYNTEKLIETKINEINSTVEQVANKALYIASISSKMEIVQQAYNEYYAGGNLEKASAIIEVQFQNINQLIFENTGYQPRIHFHLPPAISFCRCWSDIRGDDISPFRNSVLKVSREHTFVKGIETGRGGFVIRGIAPIFASTGQYYGSVEAFFNINQLLKEISINTNEEFAVLMYTDLLKIATNFLEDSSTNIIREKQIIDDYILVEKTKEFQIGNLLKHRLDSNIINNGVFEYDHYKYAIIPIKNIVGEMEGIGILQINISGYKKSLRGTVIFELILFLFLIIVVVFLLSGLSTKYIIKKIKNTDLALQKLSKGELAERIMVNHDDEIGSMQNSLNRLNENVTKNINFAIEIGKGNLKIEYNSLSKSDLLGNALAEMQKKLIKYAIKPKVHWKTICKVKKSSKIFQISLLKEF